MKKSQKTTIFILALLLGIGLCFGAYGVLSDSDSSNTSRSSDTDTPPENQGDETSDKKTVSLRHVMIQINLDWDIAPGVTEGSMNVYGEGELTADMFFGAEDANDNSFIQIDPASGAGTEEDETLDLLPEDDLIAYFVPIRYIEYNIYGGIFYGSDSIYQYHPDKNYIALNGDDTDINYKENALDQIDELGLTDVDVANLADTLHLVALKSAEQFQGDLVEGTWVFNGVSIPWSDPKGFSRLFGDVLTNNYDNAFFIRLEPGWTQQLQDQYYQGTHVVKVTITTLKNEPVVFPVSDCNELLVQMLDTLKADFGFSQSPLMTDLRLDNLCEENDLGEYSTFDAAE